MFDKYFKDFSKGMGAKAKAKTTKSKTAKTSKKAAGANAKSAKITAIDIKKIKEKLQKIIPGNLVIDSVKPIDSSGYTPEGADLIAYKEYCQDIIKIMDGYVPYELIYGTFYITQQLNNTTLTDVAKRTESVKKLNHFTGDETIENPTVIPSFCIAYSSGLSLSEIKESMVEYYIENHIEHQHELDILVVVDKGIIVKNWRERRSYIALETGADTNKSFFILMSDYLDLDRGAIDFRRYLTKDTIYTEY